VLIRVISGSETIIIKIGENLRHLQRFGGVIPVPILFNKNIIIRIGRNPGGGGDTNHPIPPLWMPIFMGMTNLRIFSSASGNLR